MHTFFLNQANNLEVIGEVVSTNPAKLRLLNRFDGAEIFRSDATFDADKQFAEISATMNSSEYFSNVIIPNLLKMCLLFIFECAVYSPYIDSKCVKVFDSFI